MPLTRDGHRWPFADKLRSVCGPRDHVDGCWGAAGPRLARRPAITCLQGRRRALARLRLRWLQARRHARSPARQQHEPRRRGREGPRARAQARLGDGRRHVDPDRRLVARTLAEHHRPAPGASADAGELRVSRPAPPHAQHRPTPPRPAPARTPRPSSTPRCSTTATPPPPFSGTTASSPGPSRLRSNAATSRAPSPRSSTRPRRDPATSPPLSTSRRPGPSWKPPRTSATPPAGRSPSPLACGSQRPWRCSGRTSTC
jgi:hypothetical protein